MALTPTGPRIGGQPANDASGRVQPRQPLLDGPRREQPRRASILRTAMDETEIGRQLTRLSRLLANDEIDQDAPRGSYLNFLV
ncbi:MAG: hypothetical protein KJ904_09180 [Alphaproteobacteria bacterium]|nr:hypothetical protein [Alphaproteobacteria bacterium]MBU0795701.1 hypothetical protein [Alphaproteobacteria bacterium]MBU0887324.1 hypothetical protein [Alphaproteobacteria bacterium]MBU1811795.1 hypothetical protein [Alphaproteobacteria bacterium]MBU2091086.1 hypothetical protein [Alphaproteobacteria bacterium]